MLKNWGFYEKNSIINQTQYFVYIIYLLYGQGLDYDRYWYILNLLPSKINIMLWSMYFFLIWFILIFSLIVTIKLRLNYLNYEEMFFVRGFIFICNYSNYKNWVFKSFQKFYEVLDFLSKVFFGVIIFESFLFYCVHKKVYPQWILFGNFHTGVSLFFGIFKILKRKCKSWRFFASQIFFSTFSIEKIGWQ